MLTEAEFEAIVREAVDSAVAEAVKAALVGERARAAGLEAERDEYRRLWSEAEARGAASARMELRKALDDLFDVVKSFEKEQKKLIAEASNGGDSIKQDNPRYAFVVKTIRDMLEVEADYKPRGVFKQEYVDGLDCSIAKLRSIEALGLILAKDAPKPGPKAVAKGASGKRK